MNSIKISNNIPTTFVDVPNRSALMVQLHSGCNLNCYQCHTQEFVNSPVPKDSYTVDQFIQIIERNAIVEAILFTGGEIFTLKDEDLLDLIKRTREVFDGEIYINTNGAYPNSLAYILDDIDGVFMDIKHDIWNASDEDLNKVLQIHPDKVAKVRIACQESVKLLATKADKVFFRTVNYPFLTEEVVTSIIKELKIRAEHHPHTLNPFYAL